MGEKKHDFTGMSQDQKTVGGVSLTNIAVIEYVFFFTLSLVVVVLL